MLQIQANFSSSRIWITVRMESPKNSRIRSWLWLTLILSTNWSTNMSLITRTIISLSLSYTKNVWMTWSLKLVNQPAWARISSSTLCSALWVPWILSTNLMPFTARLIRQVCTWLPRTPCLAKCRTLFSWLMISREEIHRLETSYMLPLRSTKMATAMTKKLTFGQSAWHALRCLKAFQAVRLSRSKRWLMPIFRRWLMTRQWRKITKTSSDAVSKWTLQVAKILDILSVTHSCKTQSTWNNNGSPRGTARSETQVQHQTRTTLPRVDMVPIWKFCLEKKSDQAKTRP